MVKNPPKEGRKSTTCKIVVFFKLLSATAYNIVDSYGKITSYGPQNNFLISRSLKSAIWILVFFGNIFLGTCRLLGSCTYIYCETYGCLWCSVLFKFRLSAWMRLKVSGGSGATAWIDLPKDAVKCPLQSPPLSPPLRCIIFH